MSLIHIITIVKRPSFSQSSDRNVPFCAICMYISLQKGIVEFYHV